MSYLAYIVSGRAFSKFSLGDNSTAAKSDRVSAEVPQVLQHDLGALLMSNADKLIGGYMDSLVGRGGCSRPLLP